MASASTVWKKFLIINKTDKYNLPSNDVQILASISSGIDSYNVEAIGYSFGQMTIENEEISLAGNINIEPIYITLLAYIIKKDFIDNQLSYNSTLYKPFTKEIGVGSMTYRTDIDSLEKISKETNIKINSIISTLSESVI